MPGRAPPPHPRARLPGSRPSRAPPGPFRPPAGSPAPPSPRRRWTPIGGSFPRTSGMATRSGFSSSPPPGATRSRPTSPPTTRLSKPARAAGHVAIRAHSSLFKVVGSTSAVDARDNTSTRYSSSDKGVAIYWLNGVIPVPWTSMRTSMTGAGTTRALGRTRPGRAEECLGPSGAAPLPTARKSRMAPRRLYCAYWLAQLFKLRHQSPG